MKSPTFRPSGAAALIPRTPPEVYSSRRARFSEMVREKVARRAVSAVAISAGWARARNFAHNVYPFRAESHFLHLVGEHLEGGILVWDRGEMTLFLTPPDPSMELWTGRAPSLREWEEELQIAVRPVSEMRLEGEVAVLPPQDEETAFWLSEVLGREVIAQDGPNLLEADARLAEVMIQLRLRQDEAALTQMRVAGRGTAEAHRAGMRATRTAGFERVVRGTMEGVLTANGLAPAYTSIVTVLGEILHAPASPHPLCPGDLLLCDVGGETIEGYAADITRTWPVSGRFSASQQELYELVLRVQLDAISKVKPGVHFSALHESAVRMLADGLASLGILRGSVSDLYESGAASLFMPHGLGHLLGLDVHDMEDLGDRAGYDGQPRNSEHPALAPLRLSRVLEAGMVVTIEPGFYQVPLLLERAKSDPLLREQVNFSVLSNYADVRGIRIEDDVLVTKDGAEVLSVDAPKSPEEIRELLR